MRPRSRLKDLKFYIPFWGTRRMLKKIKRLERDLEQMRANQEGTLVYYEARIEALYDAICKRLVVDSSTVDPQALKVGKKKFEDGVESGRADRSAVA